MAISLASSPYFAITTSYSCNVFNTWCEASFNPGDSATYNPNVVGSSVSWDFMGETSLAGIQGTETLCIETAGINECITDFQMVFITNENQKIDWLGIFLLEPVV